MLDCATNKLNGKLEDNQAMKINFSLPIAIVHAQHSTLHTDVRSHLSGSPAIQPLAASEESWNRL